MKMKFSNRFAKGLLNNKKSASNFEEGPDLQKFAKSKKTYIIKKRGSARYYEKTKRRYMPKLREPG